MTPYLESVLRRLCPDRAAALAALTERTAFVAARMNITAHKSEAEIVFFHIADSLALSPLLASAQSVCDVGTGGGFPGLALALCHPDKQFTLLDATNKKICAIRETAALLGLDNVRALVGRAEELARADLRERFDAVVSRALAPMPLCAELCLPMTAVGGRCLAMKGSAVTEELAAAEEIVGILGAAPAEIRAHRFCAEDYLAAGHFATEAEQKSTLDFCRHLRYTVVMEKIKATPPAYPRSFAHMKRGNK